MDFRPSYGKFRNIRRHSMDFKPFYEAQAKFKKIRKMVIEKRPNIEFQCQYQLIGNPRDIMIERWSVFDWESSKKTTLLVEHLSTDKKLEGAVFVFISDISIRYDDDVQNILEALK